MAGARGRCEALQRLAGERGEPWRYFVGLEGGLDVVRDNGRRLVFLESWALVRNCAGRGEPTGKQGAFFCRTSWRSRFWTEAWSFPPPSMLSRAAKAFATGRARGACSHAT